MTKESLSYKLFYSTPLEEYDLALDLLLKDILMSVFPAYLSEKFNNIRKLFNGSNLCYDSGGFQFLMRPELFDNIDPMKTLEVYNKVGFKKDDLLIQLDLPTDFYDSLKKRHDWITQSSLFYHQMREKNKQVIPVVHGWSKQELEYSLESVLDPKTIAFGSNSAVERRGRKVALGSNCATARHYPKSGNQHIGVGSYNVKEVPQITKVSFSSGSAEERRKFTPAKIIYPRFGLAVSLLKSQGFDRILALGAGGLNMCHIAFASGCSMVDGSSWRIASKFFSVFVPETAHRSFSTKRKTSKPITQKDKDKIKELWREKDYPFNDICFDELLKSLAADKKLGFLTRAIHNAYVLKWEIKNIANSYANDPDSYWDYLINKRWSDCYHWRKRALLVKEALTEDYVQTDMRAYLKHDSYFINQLTKEIEN